MYRLQESKESVKLRYRSLASGSCLEDEQTITRVRDCLTRFALYSFIVQNRTVMHLDSCSMTTGLATQLHITCVAQVAARRVQTPTRVAGELSVSGADGLTGRCDTVRVKLKQTSEQSVHRNPGSNIIFGHSITQQPHHCPCDDGRCDHSCCCLPTPRRHPLQNPVVHRSMSACLIPIHPPSLPRPSTLRRGFASWLLARPALQDPTGSTPPPQCSSIAS